MQNAETCPGVYAGLWTSLVLFSQAKKRILEIVRASDAVEARSRQSTFQARLLFAAVDAHSAAGPHGVRGLRCCLGGATIVVGRQRRRGVQRRRDENHSEEYCHEYGYDAMREAVHRAKSDAEVARLILVIQGEQAPD